MENVADKIGRIYRNSIVDEIIRQLDKYPNFMIFECMNIKATALDDVRLKIKDVNSRLFITKNTLIKRALASKGVEGFDQYLTGSSSLVLSDESMLETAKILAQFQKDVEGLNFKAGLLEDNFIDEKSFDKLAKMPSREELLSKLFGSMKAPITQYVFVLKQIILKLLWVLEEIKKTKGDNKEG